ncbi:MAG: transcriptional regulator [Thermoplasmata archaeon]|jgi:putative transcriptional regulator
MPTGRTRDRSIERIQAILGRTGFHVTGTHNIRPSSFDLVARRDSLLLLVKVLKNIDALGPDEAERLRELSRLIPAVGLVVGATSGTSPLEAGVVYMRYGIPILTEETLKEYVEKGIPPFLFSSPGGIFARINGPRLRELREDRRLSLGALASAAGVSRRTIQLYEEGAGAEITVIERIETYLGEPVVEPIDLFARRSEEAPEPADESDRPLDRGGPGVPEPTGDPLRDGVVRQLGDIGLTVTVTVRAPFDAFSRTPVARPEILLTGVGSLRAAHHRATILHGLARVIEGHAMFVVREESRTSSIDGLPIFTVQELKRSRDHDELLEALSEREAP